MHWSFQKSVSASWAGQNRSDAMKYGKMDWSLWDRRQLVFLGEGKAFNEIQNNARDIVGDFGAMASPLAKAFSANVLPKNVSRTMQRLLKRFVDLKVEPTWVTIHVHVGKFSPQNKKIKARPNRHDRRIVEIKWPVLLPHSLAHAIYLRSPTAFRKFFSANPGHFTPIWQKLAEMPWARTHPAAQHPDAHDIMLGYRIHGDCFRAWKRQKIFGLGWSAAGKQLKDGLWESYLVSALIPHRLMVTRGPKRTMWGLVKAMVDSFNVMSIKGKGAMPLEAFPGCDWGPIAQSEAGQQVAGGWCFEYLGTKGDLEFKRDIYGWMDTGRYFACTLQCCAHCFASAIIPELAYDNFQKDAPHKKTKISTQDLLANTDVANMNPLMELHGFLHELDCDDLLHALHQGIAQDLCGSALVVLGEAFFYDDHKKALEHQWECCRQMLKDFCQGLRCVVVVSSQLSVVSCQ